jgi:hypothetical protein
VGPSTCTCKIVRYVSERFENVGIRNGITDGKNRGLKEGTLY